MCAAERMIWIVPEVKIFHTKLGVLNLNFAVGFWDLIGVILCIGRGWLDLNENSSLQFGAPD